MVLEELGYRTTGTTSVKEGLSLHRKERFDVIVTDYKMPEMNGVEFIGRLREETPAVAIILLSGYVDCLGLTEKSTGADAVIMKSSHEVQHLIRAVKQLLTAKARRKPPAAEKPKAPVLKKARGA